MPPKFLAFISFLLLAAGSYAQGEFRFGMHLSPGLHYLSTDQPDAEGGAQFLFAYGGLVEYRFQEKYALATGFEIARRGGTLRINDTTATYRSGYLQFPIVLRMRTREFGYFRYLGEFGLVAGFRTSDDVEFSPSLPEENRVDRYVQLFNAGFRFGIGAEYSLGGTTALMAGLHYNRALFDNLHADDPRLRSEYRYRFDYVAVTIGFLF